MGEVVTMAKWELDRLHVVRKVLERRLTWAQASHVLGLDPRQVGRICARVRKQGDSGVIHRLRGRRGNRRLPDELLGKAASALHNPRWEGFRPHFASEKLLEHHALRLSAETVRKLMISTGLWTPRRERPNHRKWRPRRSCIGMLIQLDGSHHDWFEGRGPRCVLLVFIDDATSQILYAEFVDSEDTMNLLRTTRLYIERNGRPVAVYVDKDSIFKVNRQPTVDEELRDEQPATQYKRALDELGIELIWAHSPQAKGRVERGFQTHQDRLIKELRLAGISNKRDANRFLWDVYIPRHNGRYSVEPENSTDAHRPLMAGQDLEATLAVWSERVALSDRTIRFGKHWMQLLPPGDLGLRPKHRVIVEERVDGTIRVRFRNRYVPFKTFEKRPYRPLVHNWRELHLRREVRGKPKQGLSLQQRRLLGIAGHRKKTPGYEISLPEAPVPSFV